MMEFIALEVVHGASDGSAVLGYRAAGLRLGASSGAGQARMAMVAQGLSVGGGEIETPVIPGHGVANAYMAASGRGSTQSAGQGEAALALRARGNHGAGGAAVLGYSAVGYPDLALTAYGFFMDRPARMYAYGDQWFQVLTQPVVLGARAKQLPSVVVREVVATMATCTPLYQGTHRARDVAAFGDQLAWLVPMMVREGVTLGSPAAADYRLVARIVSRLVASGRAAHQVEAVAQVIDALVFLAIATGLEKATAMDTVALQGTVAAAYQLVARAVDRMLMQAAASGAQIMTVIVREGLVMGANLSHQADLTALVRDCVGFAATITLDSGEYLAWVLNAESKGLSTYSNYPFNSFAKVGGRYMGAAADGIHFLDGDDDNGQNIHAFIRTGLLDFGTRLLKRIPEAFIGYASDGTLLLKAIVIDEQTGEKHAAIYRMPMRGAANIQANRVKLGRGLDSVDWAFELHNVDGADFDLASVQFHPLILSRRTRG